MMQRRSLACTLRLPPIRCTTSGSTRTFAPSSSSSSTRQPLPSSTATPMLQSTPLASLFNTFTSSATTQLHPPSRRSNLKNLAHRANLHIGEFNLAIRFSSARSFSSTPAVAHEACAAAVAATAATPVGSSTNRKRAGQTSTATVDFGAEVRRWDSSVPISNAVTPPSSWYTSEEFFRREAGVFHNNWQQVGRVEQVAKPGDYFTGELMGEPYVVVRDEQGELHAFFNVCRHHASKVATGEGCKKELVCPYHGWTYLLDGRLRIAPRIGGIKDFKAKDFGLKPMKVATWGRWVFVNVDSSAEWELSKELQSLEATLEGTNYKELKFICTKNYTVKSNWKVYADNYLDGGYHVSVLHQTLSAQLDAREYKTEIFSKHSMQSCAGTTDANQDAYLRDRIGKGGAYYAFMYPNFMINRYGNMLDTNRAIPISVDETLVQFDYYMLPDGNEVPDNSEGRPVSSSVPKQLQASIAISDGIQDEDAWVSEMVQKGLNSSAYDVGRYAPQVEQAAYHFHQLLARDYAKQLD